MSGDSIKQETSVASKRKAVYMIRVPIDCLIDGRQLQHRLHGSPQQQHDSFNNNTNSNNEIKYNTSN
jgi:hypothetical protein